MWPWVTPVSRWDGVRTAKICSARPKHLGASYGSGDANRQPGLDASRQEDQFRLAAQVARQAALEEPRAEAAMGWGADLGPAPLAPADHGVAVVLQRPLDADSAARRR